MNFSKCDMKHKSSFISSLKMRIKPAKTFFQKPALSSSCSRFNLRLGGKTGPFTLHSRQPNMVPSSTSYASLSEEDFHDIKLF